jgi:hypothetical protein
VPAQDRGRGDREDLRPPAAAHQPRQRREPQPVSIIPPQSAAELAAQDLVLVAQTSNSASLDKSDRTSSASRLNRPLTTR